MQHLGHLCAYLWCLILIFSSPLCVQRLGAVSVEPVQCADLEFNWCLHPPDVTDENVQRSPQISALVWLLLTLLLLLLLSPAELFPVNAELYMFLYAITLSCLCFAHGKLEMFWVDSFTHWLFDVTHNGASILLIVMPMWGLLWLPRRQKSLLVIYHQLTMSAYHHGTHSHTQT